MWVRFEEKEMMEGDGGTWCGVGVGGLGVSVRVGAERVGKVCGIDLADVVGVWGLGGGDEWR